MHNLFTYLRSKVKLKKNRGVWINSRVDMNIESNDLITITKEGHVTGNIFGNKVIVYGKLDGNIISRFSIKLHRGAVVNGQVISKKIKIDPGVNGDINLNVSKSFDVNYFEKKIKKLKKTTEPKNITSQGSIKEKSKDNSSPKLKEQNNLNNKSNSDTGLFSEESIHKNDRSVGSFW